MLSLRESSPWKGVIYYYIHRCGEVQRNRMCYSQLKEIIYISILMFLVYTLYITQKLYLGNHKAMTL